MTAMTGASAAGDLWLLLFLVEGVALSFSFVLVLQ
jgi:hypothetical protein